MLLARSAAEVSTEAATKALEDDTCGMVMTAVRTTLPADSTRRVRMHAGKTQPSV